jgi:prepilin-type N-terminal cleavage/methylation domain-containing protein
MTMRRPAATERAFTMIEMIVVLVVLGMAMAAIFPAIGNMLRTSSRSSAISQASSEAGGAARLFEYDVRRAVGNRGTGDRDDLGSNTATISALTANNTTWSDIVEAGPTRLTVNTDAIPAVAGIERVTWEYLANNAVCGDRNKLNQNWCLRRTVVASNGTTVEIPTKGRGTYPTNTSTCGPNPQDVAAQQGISAGQASLRGIALNPLAGVRVFCYQESVPAANTNTGDSTAGTRAGSSVIYTNFNTWTSSCHQRWMDGQYAQPGTSPNTAQVTLASAGRWTTRHNLVDAPGTSTISRLDRITTVSAAILAGGAHGRANERSYEVVTVSIRSRESEAYREAIMCGIRAGWGR